MPLRRTFARLRAALAHPLTADLALDAPETTALRREILAAKPFLRAIHGEWYRWIAARVPAGAGAVLELGSGGGFLRERFPGLYASDVVRSAEPDLLADGRALPLADASLRAIAMVNVLHHLPDVELFLREAVRCLRPGGAVLMVEPWLTPWSRVIYSYLQDEPCLPGVRWGFSSSGPLSDANLALPWIVFARDRTRFAERFPALAIEELTPAMPWSYLLSGGIASRWGLPGWSYRGVRALERGFAPLERGMAMFVRIRLGRR